jgi:hypothetical protein
MSAPTSRATRRILPIASITALSVAYAISFSPPVHAHQAITPPPVPANIQVPPGNTPSGLPACKGFTSSSVPNGSYATPADRSFRGP